MELRETNYQKIISLKAGKVFLISFNYFGKNFFF